MFCLSLFLFNCFLKFKLIFVYFNHIQVGAGGSHRTLLYGQAVLFLHSYSGMVSQHICMHIKNWINYTIIHLTQNARYSKNYKTYFFVLISRFIKLCSLKKYIIFWQLIHGSSFTGLILHGMDRWHVYMIASHSCCTAIMGISCSTTS